MIIIISIIAIIRVLNICLVGCFFSLLSLPFPVALRRPLLDVQEHGGQIHTDLVYGWVENQAHTAILKLDLLSFKSVS